METTRDFTGIMGISEVLLYILILMISRLDRTESNSIQFGYLTYIYEGVVVWKYLFSYYLYADLYSDGETIRSIQLDKMHFKIHFCFYVIQHIIYNFILKK